LPPGATLKEIKAAYRAAIKAIHPDRQRGAQRDAASEEFIEATQRYEKLLQLHLQNAAVGSERMQRDCA
jgi:curved DNA-binding protein CbpA